MDADEFLQDHARWKYGKKTTAHKEDAPRTWLLAKSGYYFVFDGDLDVELKRLEAMKMPCTVHHNETSLTMAHIAAPLLLRKGSKR
jgi:hypothetical protein